MPRIGDGAPPPSVQRSDASDVPASLPDSPPQAQAEAPKKGWFAKTADRARAEVNRSLVREASHEQHVTYSAGTTLNGVGLSANAKLDARVALSNDDPLVAGDSRRRASALTGERRWTQVDATVSGAAGLGVPVAAPLTASFGLSGNVALTAIVPEDRGDGVLKGVGRMLLRQGAGLALALDADSLAKANLPPGSELMLTGSAAAGASLGVGFNSTLPFERETAGAYLGASHTEQYVKNVKVLGDGKVWAQVTRAGSDSLGASASVDVAAGSSGVHQEGSGQVIRAENRAISRVEHRVNRSVELTASASISTSDTQTLQVGGVFDLKTEAGRKAYSYLMNANPLELEATPDGGRSMLINMGMGVAYADDTERGGVSGTLRVGQRNLFQFTSAARSTQGTLMQADANGLRSTRISEEQYDREVSGDIARLANGEERRVTVRANSAETDDGEVRSALARLTVDDPKVTKEEQAGWARFAAALGQTLPPATRSDGKGHFDVQLELSTAQLKQVAARSASDFTFAFDAAQLGIEGKPPPWNDATPAKKNPRYAYEPPMTVKQQFDAQRTGWEWVQHGSTEWADRIRDYKLTTGRDLEKDMASFAARGRFAETMTQAGQTVNRWGPAVKELGALPSNDLRTELLALHRLGGAPVVSMEIDANGAKLSAAGGPPPPTADSIVGPVLRPAVVG